MKPTVIRSLGGAFSSVPKTVLGTIVGTAIEPAAAPSRKLRRVRLPAGRMGGLPGGFGPGLPRRGGGHGVVSRLGGLPRLEPPSRPRAIPPAPLARFEVAILLTFQVARADRHRS